MRAGQIDQATVSLVKNAWGRLIERYKEGAKPGEGHWTDHEVGDTGFLKDVDALNALIEPFLLAPSSFNDPPLGLDELARQLEWLLQQVAVHSENDDVSDERVANSYRGFSALPYPYVQSATDFVDSASSVLRLISNAAQLFSIRKEPLPPKLEELMSSTARSAVDFLLEARIDDAQGVRWSGVNVKEVATAKKGAETQTGNLFFTNCAALSLNRVRRSTGKAGDTKVGSPTLKNWLGLERMESIENILPRVASWVAEQYDSNTNSYWLDEGRQQVHAMGVLHALEMLYALVDRLPEDWGAEASSALTSIMKKMTTPEAASGLSGDVVYWLDLPGSIRSAYDDRRYIGAFLGLLATAQSKDKTILLNDNYITASESLFKGLSDEWIDDPTGLWDDGRPLISYSQDALLALVKFGLEGRVGSVNLKETDLRAALGEALKSEQVLEVVYSNLMERARDRKDQEIVSRLKNVAKTS